MSAVFKENTGTVKKLVLNQFGAALLGIMLSSAAMQNRLLNLITSIFAVLFYMYLIYVTVWETGARDRIRVDGGRATRDILRGLKLSLAANTPNILLGALTFIFTLLGVFTQWEWAGNAGVVTNVAARFWQGMYNGIINYLLPPKLGSVETALGSLIFLGIVIPALAVSAWAYYMGYNNRRILPASAKKTDK